MHRAQLLVAGLWWRRHTLRRVAEVGVLVGGAAGHMED